MRPLLLVTALLCSTAALAEGGKPPITAQTAKSGGPLDPDQAKLSLDTVDLAFEVFPATETMAGVATLNFTAKQAVTRLPIDLDKNLPVSAISIDGAALARSAWSNPDGRLMVTLPRRIAAGTKFAARIAYGGTPHVAVRAPWDGGFVWSKTKDGQPWIATAVQGEGCDLFWPCIDHPTYEPTRADIHITVPKGLKAISNGVLRAVGSFPDGRTTWHWSAKHPTIYGIALNIAPYEEVKGIYKSRFGNSFPMHYWYLPGEKAQAEALFAEFAPTLDFFETWIGPFPFADEKLGVVETPHLGMEHQSINAYGNGYKKAPEGFDWLFQHEFAHEWFANQLTAADWDDMWLHEGYGSYMQPLYGKWREGDARYVAMLMKQRETILNKAPIVSGRPRTEEDVYDADKGGPGGDIYVKGSWMLHTLRGLIGDPAFFEVTRRAVYGRPDPKPGNFIPRYSSSKEYRAIVDQVTKADYGWFFDVYLDSAALPDLVQTRTGSTLSLAWKTPRNLPFPMPVEVDVDGKLTRLAMTGGRDTLTVPEGAHVVVDPMARILKRSTAIEAVQAQQAAMRAK
ncbi:M1 family metallopeptidase [Sphingomonas donggukensis]|uniref:Aminopeptidase N n=1 Tax=Sphingomonas donggukensis TaxID=2949093 RepID=A0ABY4TVF8_9SPHN|nr:M1 family metallopeptidase [Sphingomonas donggukensis]URW76267.1 M1 family metallopeptidase [Sphingomonas donggukensis]